MTRHVSICGVMRPEDEVLAVAGYDRWHCTRKMYLAIHTIMNDWPTCNSEANSFAIGTFQSSATAPITTSQSMREVRVPCWQGEQIEGRALTCFEGHMGRFGMYIPSRDSEC